MASDYAGNIKITEFLFFRICFSSDRWSAVRSSRDTFVMTSADAALVSLTIAWNCDLGIGASIILGLLTSKNLTANIGPLGFVAWL